VTCYYVKFASSTATVTLEQKCPKVNHLHQVTMSISNAYQGSLKCIKNVLRYPEHYDTYTQQKHTQTHSTLP